MENNASDLIEQLDDLLEREREHLLTGNLPKFTELLDEKEQLLEQIGELGQADFPDLQHVQNRMNYNQSLLESAMLGIRAAAERLQTLRSIRRGLDTYDSQGQRRTLPNNTCGSFERRA
ncbi:flagellar biosynthesis protein FlgN [Cognatishimia sp. 1_MG-2023]|uniref:flagellar biosynthesis protein FlgN n=1 Tax=Cognatishimia sp. 1_MG-2023 TaxID=3062642 RepID=UPI0026E28829|nr:flagellar biosynthesis protein FlgN [Cognatishimia sp. 1_MG-2023]MDO6726949.1 flagellar biosynthesis protein FlgN [Cognatishimia sp. 1_MG-2023]